MKIESRGVIGLMGRGVKSKCKIPGSNLIELEIFGVSMWLNNFVIDLLR